MNLDIAKSVTYIFDDPDWVTKILIMLAVGVGAGLLMIVLFLGLVLVAAQVGWQIQLIRNVKDGVEHPMPAWDDFGKKIALGAQPMIAGVVYFLPIILLSCILFLPAAMAGDEDIAGAMAGGAMCLYLPLMIVYGVAASVFLSMGQIRYAETEQIGDFFKFSQLWEMFTRDNQLTLRFIGYLVLVGIVMGAVSSTTIGSLIPAAFNAPIIGHLTGQFAAALDTKPKRA